MLASARCLILVAAFAGGATAALAQEAKSGRLLSLEETRECLCLAGRLDTIAGDLQPLLAEYKRVDELVTKARPHVNTSDQDEVDSFRRLFARREALRQQLQTDRGQRGFDALVGRYNQLCARNRMFKVNVDQIRAEPTPCPQNP
jgi:hypothetical protein